MGDEKPKPPPMALHSTPGGFRPNSVFQFVRACYHRMPLVGRIGPALKSVFYGALGVIAPRSGLVQRYRAWCALQERKRFFREPLPGLSADDAVSGAPSDGTADGRAPTLPDILIYPVIDWDYRFQRPQQLAVEMANRGHRVYYLEPEVNTRGAPGEMPAIRQERENLYRVMLPHSQPLKVYEKVCTPEQASALRRSLELLLSHIGSRDVISLLNHPGWFPVAHYLPANTLVYDCMDHHAGFGGMEDAMQNLEEECARLSDVRVVTAGLLRERFKSFGDVVMVPNAADFDYFSKKPEPVQAYGGAKVIGYYGAIAEWFDGDTVAAVARAYPDCRVVLIGDTLGADLSLLEGLSNVEFPGEVPYEDLTQYLYGFDVCLLPFKVNDLTLATSPVKVYEYLSAGKPVVSVKLPEVEPMDEHIYLAEDKEEFVAAVSRALTEEGNQEASRKAFAAANTWRDRTTTLMDGICAKADPKVSVVVLTWNNLALTKACLRSVLEFSNYPNLELIVADNGSDDGTVPYLEDLACQDERVRCVLHGKNLGFAAGNNKAVHAATGEYLVFLNNDTAVTPGWIRDMLRHFRDNPKLGVLGPVSNNVGNEARIEIEYADLDEMRVRARSYCREHAGETFDLRAPAFFCTMMPRRLWDEIGELDERFGLGFFEDDDYAMRVRKAGYQTRCAEDVFIHHHLSATFDKRPESENAALFERNRKLYEEKWGPWVPHQDRKENR